jgi:hypothetical protein
LNSQAQRCSRGIRASGGDKCSTWTTSALHAGADNKIEDSSECNEKQGHLFLNVEDAFKERMKKKKKKKKNLRWPSSTAMLQRTTKVIENRIKQTTHNTTAHKKTTC